MSVRLTRRSFRPRWWGAALALAHAPRVLAASPGHPEGRVWPSLNFEQYSRWSGLAVQAILLAQHSELGDGLVRDWPRPDFGIERHESCALQWYLLAALSIVLFVVLSFRDDYRPPE